jgi:hypothetical protein
MLRGKPMNLHENDDLLWNFRGGDTIIPEHWTYTMENDIVKHNTLLGFVLNAPMGRKIAVTIDDIYGLVTASGFTVEGSFIDENSQFIVPHTKNLISYEEVQAMSIYTSSGVFEMNDKVDAWALAGFPPQG